MGLFCICVGQSTAFVNPAARRIRGEQLLQSSHFWGEERSDDEIIDHLVRRLSSVDFKVDQREQIQVLSAEPLLVVIGDFLSRDMCREIIQTTLDTETLKISTTSNEKKRSSVRTSTTAWLKDAECEGPLRLLASKVSAIVGLPPSHMENLQVVRYCEGQEFKVHTDHLDSFNDLECRGRVATCLIYLSAPALGGSTWFLGLEKEVEARRGTAVFFWNTIEKPGSEGYSPDSFLHADDRMRHAGLPVLRGEKWICNRWVHPTDFHAGVRGI